MSPTTCFEATLSGHTFNIPAGMSTGRKSLEIAMSRYQFLLGQAKELRSTYKKVEKETMYLCYDHAHDGANPSERLQDYLRIQSKLGPLAKKGEDLMKETRGALMVVLRDLDANTLPIEVEDIILDLMIYDLNDLRHDTNEFMKHVEESVQRTSAQKDEYDAYMERMERIKGN